MWKSEKNGQVSSSILVLYNHRDDQNRFSVVNSFIAGRVTGVHMYTYILKFFWNLSRAIIEANLGVKNSNSVDQLSEMAGFLINPIRILRNFVIFPSVTSLHGSECERQEGGVSMSSALLSCSGWGFFAYWLVNSVIKWHDRLS